MKEFINVILDDSYPLYEYYVANELTDMEYEEWLDSGEDLGFFEGDPDMIKVDGWTGYFYECGDKVFYYFDSYDSAHDAEEILRAFFEAFRTGVTIGCESWIDGDTPDGVSAVKGSEDCDIWDKWERLETGIAWRGGAGYYYWITDWGEWLEKRKGGTQKAA